MKDGDPEPQRRPASQARRQRGERGGGRGPRGVTPRRGGLQLTLREERQRQEVTRRREKLVMRSLCLAKPSLEVKMK